MAETVLIPRFEAIFTSAPSSIFWAAIFGPNFWTAFVNVSRLTWGGAGREGWRRGRAKSFERRRRSSIWWARLEASLHLYDLIIIGVSSEDEGGDVRGEVGGVRRDRLPAPRLPILLSIIILLMMTSLLYKGAPPGIDFLSVAFRVSLGQSALIHDMIPITDHDDRSDNIFTKFEPCGCFPRAQEAPLERLWWL